MNDLFYEYHILKCKQCGKESLLEIHQCGVSHIALLHIVCVDCAKKTGLSDDYKKQHPKEYKEIKKLIG